MISFCINFISKIPEHFPRPYNTKCFIFNRVTSWFLASRSQNNAKAALLRLNGSYLIISKSSSSSHNSVSKYGLILIWTYYYYCQVDKPPSNNVTLDQYTIAKLPIVLQANESRFPVVNESISYNFNGNSAIKIVLITTKLLDPVYGPNDPENVITEKTTQIWSIKNDKVYIISYNAFLYAYNDYLPAIEKIFNSIKVDQPSINQSSY